MLTYPQELKMSSENPLGYLGAPDASTTVKGISRLATVAETTAGVRTDLATTPAGVAAVAIAGAPDASTTQKGIIEIATNAEAAAGAATDKALVPSNIASLMGSPGAIGGVTPAAGTFTTLTTTSTVLHNGGTFTVGSDNAANNVVLGSGTTARTITIGGSTGAHIVNIGNASAGAVTVDSAAGISLDAATASNFTVTGAADLTLATSAGSLNLTAGQDAADSILISSAAGGIDILATGEAGQDIDIVNTGGSINITATEDVAQAIYIRANAGTSETIQIHADQGTGVASVNVVSDVGGITLSSGLASADAINLSASAGGVDIDGALQVNIASSQNAATAIVITASAGGIDITAPGASAGEDIDIVATGSSVNITSTEDIADAIVLSASAGGIDILATGEAAQDIDIINTGGSINITATENVANAVYIRANGGTSETIRIHSDQGTGAGSVLLLSDDGGITLTATALASADAINLEATAGGIDMDAALQVNIASSQNAVDAIRIVASAGGIDIDAVGAATEDINITNTGGSIVLSATESAVDAIKIEATTGGIDILASGAAAGEDIDIIATGSSVNIQATEAIASAITINASNAAGGIQITAGTGDIAISGTIKEATTEFMTRSGDSITFQASPILQSNANTGVAPTGATGDTNLMLLQEGIIMQQFILGAGQTIIAPRMTTTGLLVSLDLTNTEGVEYNFGVNANSRHAYTIGTSAAFFFQVSLNVADVSGGGPYMIGFRKQEANNATLANYTDYAMIGMNASVSATNISLLTELNAGGQTTTDTTDAWADGTTKTLAVLVSAAGVVTYTIDGVAPSVTAAFTFDSGDVVMPFIRLTHTADAGAVNLISMKAGFQA